jgi:hypothetical protein
MKTGAQMIRDCEALQKLEHLTVGNWHDMADADAELLAHQLAAPEPLTAAARAEAAEAAKRLLMFAQWSRSYALATSIYIRRP